MMPEASSLASSPRVAPPPLAGWLRDAAQRVPGQLALETPDARLTYAELLTAVETLVQALRAKGFATGDRIGIAATRSSQAIIAILAAVDAGLGYVPLDLSYPPERLRAMLHDAQPRAVLGDSSALASLRELAGDFATLDAPAPRGKRLHASADDLAYVLFTSGSTGRPKGVALGTTPLAHLIHFHATHPQLGKPARTLQFAPLSFDVHFQEIFSTMACAGTLVLVPEAVRRDPAQLEAAIRDLGIERLFMPYVALQMIAEAARDRVPESLLDVVSAGEQLQITPAIRSLFARLPRASLHNHYGPTESHVVIVHELPGAADTWPQIPPIGQALPHVRLALRDPETLTVTTADTGELLLGGDTLAHGYLGRPELTAERFLDRVAGLQGRWYATGDLVRRDAAGDYTYLGRADQQLKVDGFRIEPGEIELALMAQPAVKDAVVTAPDLPGIGKQLIAHIVLRIGADTSQLRSQLRERLPEYMVPVRFVELDRLPTTPSGKIDRRNLPLPQVEAVKPGSADAAGLIRSLWQELLGTAQIGDDQNLFDLGARSLLVLRFVTRLKDLGVAGITVADVYDRPTLAGITAAAQGQTRARKPTAGRPQATSGIAIVGMASRTPGAGNVAAFWQNLLDGREGIRHFSADELDLSVPESLRTRSNFVAARGVLEDADRFDAAFFGISAREATVLDPQQRLLLELCWTALEDAAIDTARADARVGVYAGSANNTYATLLRQEQPELVQQYGEFATMLASEKDYVATRVAHRLNLNGPAVSIHTACSTGLVAVAQAWHALASGQCDIALAGGATVVVPQLSGYLHVEGGMESADGHCRPFDADATGTVFASGGAVVVLKRLEDALADGDTVHAVIRGVGLNNDGGDKASFTAPSVSGQAGAIRMALEHAQLSARSIGYVEAHGTGTSLGDPIELAALTRAWREDTADNQFCGIGSVKSNLGHMVAAAGVVGLIKAVLSLQREVIPGTLHYRRSNPQIDFANTPFRVVAQNTPWLRGSEVRRAAVSSFGVGGTNAHVVIEEAPAPSTHASSLDGRLLVLPLSARSAEAALQRARDLADHLERNPDLALADVAATLMRGRRPMSHRLSVVAGSSADAVNALRGAKSSVVALAKPRVVFLFPGQGSQHPSMARRLYDEVPSFREALDRCLAIAVPALGGVDLRHWLLEADPADEAVARLMAETRHAQPLLFSVSYALAAWLDSLAIVPDAMIGHSIGEYAAACHAGVFSLADALAAVIARGQAMFEQPRGAMLAVRASAESLHAKLPAGVEIAGCNAPALTVVSGSHAAIEAFAAQLEAQDIGTTVLRVSHAFHSASMDGALTKVAKALANTALHAPRRTVYSCISGQPLQPREATDPQYWARQVRATVQFSAAVTAELAQGDTVFVEVGPGQALTALLRQHRTPQGAVPRQVALLGAAQNPGDPAVHALEALGALWCAGVEPAWPVPTTARRVPLPTYPFKGERYWFTRRAMPAEPAGVLLPSTAPSVAAVVPPAEVTVTMSRIPRLEHELQRIFSDVSGVAVEDMTRESSFVDQGLDSLSLTQATLELERLFGVKLRFRRLLEDLDNVEKLAGFLDGQLPADKFAPEPAALAAPVAVATPVLPVAPIAMVAAGAPAVGSNALQQLIQQQMQLMSQQLALLSGQAVAPVVASMPAAAALVAQPTNATTRVAAPAAPTGETASDTPSTTSLVEKPFGASPRLTLKAKQEFTPAQRAWLDEFIRRCDARFGQSKAFSQKYRKVMADPRVATGFNPLWKDLVYPIVVDRSKGARLWDLDGNEFIDLLSCFGANLLGYQPDDVREAMIEQLKAGIEVGPQHPIAAEVAELISEFTGMERIAFCNTGSEAVMGAMRIARTVTGRKTIAIFTNSYHGIFDEVVVRGTKQLRSLSAAPGILANAVENVLVLDYCSDDALRILKERGHELAAVMIEPIQNKYPTMQPREFVKSLRSICDDAGCALIFDEVVTGFRVAPGGAQELLGVRADIATFGKVIGGGLSFAAIGGSSHWMDALDGGHWQYGDDSYPEAGVTYFAGTFVRHPLALAGARASLLHLKRGGRELYRTINDRTQAMITRLNTAFAARGAPVKAVHCASLWRLAWDDGQKYVSLFYWLVRYHGLHLYEQFGHFVTEAMGDAETDRIFKVFTEAIDELMALGLITPREGGPAPRAPGDGSKDLAEGPLTPGQTERWLAGAFDPAARRALNESLCVGLKGDVDVVALKAALQDVLTRHDAFRVRFDLDQPQQRLAPAGPVPVAEIDLRAQPDADAALDAFCTEASRRDLPVDQAPLAAVSLLQLADGRVVVHVVASHLIFDGWASSVFNAELATAYRARSMGLPAQLPPAESPLLFGTQEQARFDGPDGQEALAFWREQLRNPPAPLALGDLTPPSPRLYAADTVRVNIDGTAFAQLRAQARQSGATLFQLLLTAVTVMLQRRSGQPEFVVSIPYASQSLQRHGPLIADGVLDLPLRLGCSATDTAASVLKQVRTRLMDALEYPLMTQGTVARELGIRSAGDRPPLTGIYFNLNPRIDLSAYAPLAASMHEGRKAGTLSELFFNFYEKDDALTLDLHYSRDFFSPARAQELVDALIQQCAALAQTLAMPVGTADDSAAMPARPTQPAPSAPAIDPRLTTWNATAVALEPRARIEDWVSRQAARSPDDIAIVARGTSLSYRALEARANRFANLLRSKGVGPGMLIGVGLSRGPDLVPALLGVLKTGAAYVPLDPGFPRDRLHYMAEDAEVKFVITEAVHADLSGVSRAQQIRIDDDAAVIAAASDAAVAAPSDWADDAPAYVIYTSGSTGKPKGVVLPQRAVCNFLASVKREPGLTAGDRLLAVTTLSFDIAVLELFLPLITGARVVLAQRDDAMDGEVLGRLIVDQGINVMQATPTTWHMLLDANWRAPAGFRALCGGEALPPSLAQRLLAAGVELWNMFGPTETTVWSTLSRVTDANAPIVIGRPMDNTSVWVLGDDLRPTPIGVEGEICIGGAGVANGYFKRPELTAERFIADPFDATPGARLYRTGDLGRWRADGALEHLGRLDFQVKIRGYRIELGEIEASLAALNGVARSVVIPREDTPGDVRLVAYVVALAGVMLDPVALRDALRGGALPDYMLPHAVVVLETLPLLPNGKIDRKALPAPVGPVIAAKPNGVAPRNELERAVAKAMQTVLKVGDIGVGDDFFTLGGHSLLAARLIGQINRELDLHLSLRALFESPTVEGLARAIEQSRGADAAPPRPPIVRQPVQDSAPLTLMQDRVNFFERMHPGRVAYHSPAGHRLRGSMNVELFDRAFAEMVRRQAAFRTAIVASGDGYVQRIADTSTLSLLPLVDLSALPETEREAALLSDMKSLVAIPFALDQAPLFSARLYRLGEDHHAMFFMAHHVVWDGWSFDVLYNEMAAHYAAFVQGKPSPLPELPVSYGDFAHWHNAWMESDEIHLQTDFWKRQYDTSPPQKSPFADRPRRQLATGKGGTEYLELSAAHSDQIRQLARQTGSTVSIVMLSIYAVLMSQWMRDPAPAIGLPVRGRPAPELEGVMGFFNNMLPLRLPVDAALSCLDWVKAVRRMVTAAISNQDVPFELVAQKLALGAGNLYQVLFNFQDLRDRPTQWGPLAHDRINVMQDGATENLNLWIVESAAGISGGMQYDADLFMPSTAAALCKRLVALLEQMVVNPQQPIEQLLQAMPSELTLLEGWERAATSADGPGDVCDAINARIAAAPSAIALRDGATVLTLGEFGERVQRFEALLRGHLLTPGKTVVVSTTDPVAQLVAGLAALRCDAACLALGTDAAERGVAEILQANDVAAIVCDDWLKLVVPTGIVRIDTAQVPGARVQPRPAGQGGAVAGATPGSIDRATLSGLWAGLAAPLMLRSSERLLCVDGSARAWQLTQALVTLAAGSELVLGKRELDRNGAGLLALLRGENIRAVHLSANGWRRVLTALNGAPLPIKAMLDVTESSPELVEALLGAGCTVVSMYRASGTGLPVAAAAITEAQDTSVFGRPFGTGAARVTDAAGRRVPAGMAGELQVAPPSGGEGFVATGSLVRWRSDGVLQYLGELGSTTYIDGHRIALNELESRLNRHPQVARSLVIARSDRDGQACLAAYVVPKEGGPTAAAMKAQLRGSAPEHLLPLHYPELASIPTFANGEVNLNALPAVSSAGPGAADERECASTPTEIVVADIWKKVLKVDRVGVNDNFFDLGGHSLLAMSVASEIKTRLGTELNLRQLIFESLGQIAASLEADKTPPVPVVVHKPKGWLHKVVARLQS